MKKSSRFKSCISVATVVFILTNSAIQAICFQGWTGCDVNKEKFIIDGLKHTNLW